MSRAQLEPLKDQKVPADDLLTVKFIEIDLAGLDVWLTRWPRDEQGQALFSPRDLLALEVFGCYQASSTFHQSTGVPWRTMPDEYGREIPVIGWSDHAEMARKLPRYDAARGLLAHYWYARAVRRDARPVPGAAAQLSSRPALAAPRALGVDMAPPAMRVAPLAGLGDVSMGGAVVIGVCALAAPGAAYWLGRRYIDQQTAAEVQIEKARAEAEAGVKTSIARERIARGDMVPLGEADKDAAVRMATILALRKAAPWIGAGVGLAAIGGVYAYKLHKGKGKGRKR